ncbi:MAG: cupin domain-containing protein [Chloroflexi bacterium]|nr:cupin domain-containing protein [Chloroflexota bacterium]
MFIPDLKDNLPEIPVDSIVSQTIHKQGDHKTILFGFAPGQELSEHTASQPAMLYFVEGEADLTLGDASMSVQPGTWVYMQPKLAHSILAKTRLIMLLLLL